MISLLRRNRWWLSRVLVLPIHLLLFISVIFVMIRLIPGDPVVALLPPQYTHEDYLRMQAAVGLDGSIWDQWVRYAGGLLRFDLGKSIISGAPALDQLATRFPPTLELTLQTVSVTVLFSGVAAYIAVVRPRNAFSGAMRAFAQTAGAIPDYVLAIVGILVLYSGLGWIPAPIGRLDPRILAPTAITNMPMLDAMLNENWAAFASIAAHTALPIFAMSIAQAPLMLRLLIAGYEEAVQSAPIRFKIAAGAKRGHVVASVVRRAIPPAVIMCAGIFGGTLGGTVVLENMFGFTGIGTYAVGAVSSGDYTAMQAILLMIAAISLLLYLLIDLVNMVLDPRRRPGVRTEE